MRVKLKPKSQPPPVEDDNEEVVEVDYTKHKDRPWSAEKLYGHSQGHRRVLVLEMLSSMIAKAERIETRGEWERFKRRLESDRVEARGQRPWAQATDHERFLAHLVDMADTFVTAEPVSAVSGEGRRPVLSDKGA